MCIWFTRSPDCRVVGSLSGTISSFMATRIVPCTGGANRRVSRTTAFKSGSKSRKPKGSSWLKGSGRRAVSSSRNWSWTSGYNARKWKTQAIDIDVVSDPANYEKWVTVYVEVNSDSLEMLKSGREALSQIVDELDSLRGSLWLQFIVCQQG